MSISSTEKYRSLRWPAARGVGAEPKWTGRGFDIGGELLPVLPGDFGASGWSEDLADIVNLEVAADRPLGIASRRHALDALGRSGAAAEGKTVLEVGCANGYLLEAIARQFPQSALIGADYALPPLAALAKRLPEIPLIQLDLVRSTLPDAFCDAVVALNVLEHIEDDIAALRQIRRMLKPGGLLILEVPSSPSLFDDFDRLAGHFRRYTMGDLTAKLKTVGFTIGRRSHLGFFVFPAYWILIQAKKLTSRADGVAGPELLKSRIKAGRRSLVQHVVFSFETRCRPFLAMPFGVRCLATATAS